MRKKFRILAIVVVAALISFVCEQPRSLVEAQEIGANTFDANGDLCISGGTTPQEIGTPMELWAGVGNEDAGTLVGYITFDSESVRINLTDLDGDGIPDMYPWVATAVHIHFAETVDGIPVNNSGNPQIGHFDVNIDEEDGDDVCDYIFEVADPYSSVIVIPSPAASNCPSATA